jgi:hypothetical protein
VLLEAVNSKKTGITVQGFDDWLNISQYHPIATLSSVGELVEFQFERTERGAWIQSLTSLGAAPSAPGRDAEIRRQVAIKTAAQLVAVFAQTREEVKVDHVFPLADKTLAWLEQS